MQAKFGGQSLIKKSNPIIPKRQKTNRKAQQGEKQVYNINKPEKTMKNSNINT